MERGGLGQAIMAGLVRIGHQQEMGWVRAGGKGIWM